MQYCRHKIAHVDKASFKQFLDTILSTTNKKSFFDIYLLKLKPKQKSFGILFPKFLQPRQNANSYISTL